MRHLPAMGKEQQADLGVIGGSGLYDLDVLQNVQTIRLETPFGKPSDEFLLGTLSGVRVAFLPRHGKGHRISPSELNFRANIHAMKQLGVKRLLSVGAVGSLREEIPPGDLVVPDQFLDRTFHREATFFDRGVVAHVQFGDPVCAILAAAVVASAQTTGAKVHEGGTYICMEGPQFSTRAESNLYRSWGASIIGMTNLQEAKLAREAEMCFSTLALSTDYDCWHEEEEDVDVAAIVAVIQANAARAAQTIAGLAGRLPTGACACHSSLAGAILTDPATVSTEARERLALIAGAYLEKE
jgi:5'-methylthioadenosine phosphorylase